MIEPRDVCVHRAVQLLEKKQMVEDELMAQWENQLPFGIEPDISMLQGVALQETVGDQTVIKYFPVQNLPDAAPERFQALFEVRAKWTRDSILPYLSDLVQPNMTMDQMLIKFSRTIQAVGDQPRYFCKK